MKNILKTTTLIIALLLAAGTFAQTLRDGNHRTTGSIRSDGAIKNASYNTTGYTDGNTIRDANHNPVGYIGSDGTIKNSSYVVVGYVTGDGVVQNSSHNTIGYIKNDGTVQDAGHRTIGYASGVRKELAAASYFFFHLN